MGMECIDYGLHMKDGASLIVAVDLNQERLERASRIMMPQKGDKKLVFADAGKTDNIVEYLMNLTNGKGYDDVFVYAPVEELIEQADQVLAEDGCLNFFAGPIDQNLSAKINFYRVTLFQNTYGWL